MRNANNSCMANNRRGRANSREHEFISLRMFRSLPPKLPMVLGPPGFVLALTIMAIWAMDRFPPWLFDTWKSSQPGTI